MTEMIDFIQWLFINPFFTNLIPILVAWILVFLATLVTGKLGALNKNELKVYLLIIFGYPIIALLLKYFILTNIINRAWYYFNWVEHLAASFAMPFLFYPWLKPYWKSQPALVLIISVVGLVCILGNMNELTEFYLRYIDNDSLNHRDILEDSMFDLVINFIGGLLASIAILRLRINSKD
jgi:hypothetical protein